MKAVYKPLQAYANEFRGKFAEILAGTFRELVDASGIDVSANKKTVAELRSVEKDLSEGGTNLSCLRFCRTFLWIVAVAGFGIPVFLFFEKEILDNCLWILIVGPAAGTIALILIFGLINDKIKMLRERVSKLTEKSKNLKKLAWNQMAPLNRLYDWDLTLRMISKAVPAIEFDPFFTQRRVLDLREIYAWDDSFNNERSVIFANSGTINGNPFVFCKTLEMAWGTRTYYGEKRISWTERVRGTDGKYRTVFRTQTLVASLEKPVPEHFTGTFLIYGNTAAPNLKFYRQKSGYADGGFGAWMKKRELRKFSRKLDDESQYTMMQNEAFEVAFETKNRNNEREFRLLFTPLAQEAVLELLRDKTYGFGDDFNFEKNKMINTVTADHLDRMKLETNPKEFKSYDFEAARKAFFDFNTEYFRGVYFSFAPLLCVPAYQQIRSRETIYGDSRSRRAAFWEHESLANYWGSDRFKHPSCVTPCILKTQETPLQNGSRIKVLAHGFRKVRRVSVVKKFGGDGRCHDVPVQWDEYFPVCGEDGFFYAREDADAFEKAFTPRERAEHIAGAIRAFGGDNGVYRRNMVSSL